MNLAQTVDLPRRAFVEIAIPFLEAETPRLIAATKASGPMIAQIKSLIEEADAAGVRLDDAAAETDPKAADIRRRMARSHAKMTQLRCDIKARDDLIAILKTLHEDGLDGAPISLGAKDALRLLGLRTD